MNIYHLKVHNLINGDIVEEDFATDHTTLTAVHERLLNKYLEQMPAYKLKVKILDSVEETRNFIHTHEQVVMKYDKSWCSTCLSVKGWCDCAG
tara:strand:+ start:2358 stop:2636 length:279 start_codon:yes stop_codon:yes gene_type:complete